MEATKLPSSWVDKQVQWKEMGSGDLSPEKFLEAYFIKWQKMPVCRAGQKLCATWVGC